MFDFIRKKTNTVRILTIFLLTVIIVSTAIALSVGANTMDSTSGSMSMALVDVSLQENTDYISSFNTEGRLVFTIAFYQPRKNDTIVIDMDDKIFVRNTSIDIGSPLSAQAKFSNDGRRVEVTTTRAMDTQGYMQIVIPFVYNQLETRTQYEAQYEPKILNFTTNTQNSIDVPINVEREIYDFNGGLHNPFIKNAVEKLYYDSSGKLRVRMNAFYNYGNNTFQNKKYVTISNDWEKCTFCLDRSTLSIKKVTTPVDSYGKMVTSPADPYEGYQIWKYGDKTGKKSSLIAAFSYDDARGFGMKSAKTADGSIGGFSGSDLTGTDALMLSYELQASKNFRMEGNELYSVTTTFAGAFAQSYLNIIPANTYVELKSTATFKYPSRGFGSITEDHGGIPSSSGTPCNCGNSNCTCLGSGCYCTADNNCGCGYTGSCTCTGSSSDVPSSGCNCGGSGTGSCNCGGSGTGGGCNCGGSGTGSDVTSSGSTSSGTVCGCGNNNCICLGIDCYCTADNNCGCGYTGICTCGYTGSIPTGSIPTSSGSASGDDCDCSGSGGSGCNCNGGGSSEEGGCNCSSSSNGTISKG